MHKYKFGDFCLNSNLELPELVSNAKANGEITQFELQNSIDADFSKEIFYQHWKREDDSVWLSFAKTKQGYLLLFPEISAFIISKDRKHISCRPLKNVDKETIRHLLIDCVLPLSISQDKYLVLHGSAVRKGNQVVSFVGNSGSGKSSLAAYFCLNNWTLASDDILLLRKIKSKYIVYGSYPGLRLWPKMRAKLLPKNYATEVSKYNDKQRVQVDSFCREPIELTRIYLLPAEQSDFNPFMILTSCSFQLDITDNEKVARNFEMIKDLLSTVEVVSLDYEKTELGLSKALKKVSKDL